MVNMLVIRSKSELRHPPGTEIRCSRLMSSGYWLVASGWLLVANGSIL